MRRLSYPTMVAYGFGQVGEALMGAGFGTFLLFYYQQIIGVSGTVTATALALSLMVDALCDPIVGSLSDKIRTRWGRRHPFIVAAALPLCVGFYCLFNPPAGLTQAGYFVWLTVFAIITRQSLTVFHVPHLALGAEMARDYTQRSTLYSFNILFSSLGGAVGTAIAYRAFFPTTQEFDPGLLNPAGYHTFSIAFAVGIFVAILVCALGTWHEIPHLLVRAEAPGTKSAARAPRASLPRLFVQMVREFRVVFANPSFKSVFFGMMLAFLMLSIEGVFGAYMGVHFWGLTTEQLSLLPFFAVVGLLGSLLLIVPVTRWLDKKMTLVWCAVIAILNGNVLVMLRLFAPDWFPANGSSLILPLIALTTFVGSLMGPLIFATLNSMFADIVDEHELATGKRQEGIVFAARSFAVKVTTSVGLIVGGWLLDAIGFPKAARAGTVAADVLWDLGFIVGPATSVFVLAGVFMYLGYSLDRDRHAQVVRELAQRRAEAGHAE
jgi:Na+/melibiose symporter-like transporter